MFSFQAPSSKQSICKSMKRHKLQLINQALIFTILCEIIISFNQPLTMESSPPQNLANLNQLFNQYDADQDGKVNDQEILKIFNDVGFTDVYIGTIRKVIRLMNLENPDEQYLNFPQLQEFAEAMITKGKFKVWKMKKSFMQEIKLGLNQIYGQQQNGASPGAGPGSAPAPTSAKQINSQEGEILLNVGNTAASNQYLNVALEKQTGQEIKPFVKISIERNNNEEAIKIQTLFKQIYDTVIEILKAEQQELISEILSVSFITSVSNNVFNLFITTANESLIELAEIFVSFTDQFIKNPINGKIQGFFKFDFDFQKFINEPSYNFYDLMVKNSSFHLKWNLWEFFVALRKFALAAKLFDDLEWDQTNEFCLFIIGLLHCERFVGKMEFNNTSSEGQETKTKEELTQVFQGIRKSLSQFGQETGLALVEMVSQLDGKISIEVGVKDWRLNVEARLKNFVKLFTEKIEGASDNDEEVQQASINQSNCLILNKQSSKKSLKKQSSIQSLKKQSSKKSLKKQSSKKSLKKQSSKKSFHSSSSKRSKKGPINAKDKKVYESDSDEE